MSKCKCRDNELISVPRNLFPLNKSRGKSGDLGAGWLAGGLAVLICRLPRQAQRRTGKYVCNKHCYVDHVNVSHAHELFISLAWTCVQYLGIGIRQELIARTYENQILETLLASTNKDNKQLYIYHVQCVTGELDIVILFLGLITRDYGMETPQ